MNERTDVAAILKNVGLISDKELIKLHQVVRAEVKRRFVVSSKFREITSEIL